jgi:hypothetical protein
LWRNEFRCLVEDLTSLINKATTLSEEIKVRKL